MKPPLMATPETEQHQPVRRLMALPPCCSTFLVRA